MPQFCDVGIIKLNEPIPTLYPGSHHYNQKGIGIILGYCQPLAHHSRSEAVRVQGQTQLVFSPSAAVNELGFLWTC